MTEYLATETVDTPEPGVSARQAAFLATLKLGDAVRMNKDGLVASGPYDRVAVVTDITDGKISFIIRQKD